MESRKTLKKMERKFNRILTTIQGKPNRIMEKENFIETRNNQKIIFHIR
jgi:hypothetical protein